MGKLTLLLVAGALLASNHFTLAQTPDQRVDAFVDALKDADVRSRKINMLCANEWPTDFRMQEYCINKQREGYRDLVEVYNSAIQIDALKPAVLECVLDWSDELLIDWRMVRYCINKQVEAYKRLRR